MSAQLALALAVLMPALQAEPGTAGSACRTVESGPSIIVDVEGLKDRAGLLKLEVYPANDRDFLADDTALIAAGKTFRRIDVPVPVTGPVSLCVRTPSSGMIALVVLHDRDRNRRLTISSDGIGFSNNPALSWSKPKVSTIAIPAPRSPTHVRIVMNYRQGIFKFGPLR